MLELNLLDDRDKAAEEKRQQGNVEINDKKHLQLLALEFGNVEITEYPPDCTTSEQRQRFDAEVLVAAQSASNAIKREVPADSIRWIVSAYACRKFALSKALPSAVEFAAELSDFIKRYKQRDNALLSQMTGAAEPLAEALERLELVTAFFDRGRGRPANMPMGLFIADMARLYTELTGKRAGINKADNKKGRYDGGPFAKFSYAAYRLAVTTVNPNKAPAESSASWSEAVADWQPLVWDYLEAEAKQDESYKTAAETAHLDWPELIPPKPAEPR